MNRGRVQAGAAVATPSSAAPIGWGAAASIFGAFAFAYFFSALLRAVTATLAPAFSAELGLNAADLGLLAGAYFFGFAAMQLPLGRALDRFGPRRTLLVLLAVAVLGCVGFAMAGGIAGLIGARALIGVGVAACLMAPLTSYRRLFSAAAQLRANSWMLMTGSLGMLASTLPVQWLLPATGWRGLFFVLALCLAAAIGLIAWWVPRDAPATGLAARRAEAEPAPAPAPRPDPAASGQQNLMSAGTATRQPVPPVDGRYRAIVRHPLFVRTAPLGFFVYGGLIAVQALWAGPWLTRVSGRSAAEAAEGLFTINLAMLFTFFAWGALMPRLSRRGVGAERIMAIGVPLPLLLLAWIVVLGSDATAWHWAAWCMACTFVSVSQPAVGAAFPAALAGRALSAYNLVIFGGVFCLQWGIGLAIDALRNWGLDEVAAFRVAFAAFGVGGLLSYAWFLVRPPAPGLAGRAAL